MKTANAEAFAVFRFMEKTEGKSIACERIIQYSKFSKCSECSEHIEKDTLMSVNGLNTPLSGLSANQFRQDVTAKNVANVNTAGFQPSTVQTADAAYINDIGQGTRVSATYAPPRAVPAQAANAPQASGMAETSNVDLLTETMNRMNAQSAYNVNIPAARTMDEMSQTLMDLRG